MWRIIVGFSAVPGCIALYYRLTIDTLGRKPIRIMGFTMLTILFIVIGFVYHKLSRSALLGECFLTRYRSTSHGFSAASGKVGVENSTRPSHDEVTIASKRLVRTRNLGRGRKTPDSDVSDSLHSGPEPKRRRILPIRDEVSDDQLSSHFQSSKLVTRKCRPKPKACHQKKSLCRGTDDNSDEGTDTSSKPDFSDADDEDDMSQKCVEVGEDVAVLITRNVALMRTFPPPEVQRNILAGEFTSIPMAPSSQDSSSSQSGPASQNPIAELELKRLESVTGVQSSPNHRDAIVKQCLALGKRETLENFRQACFYWRKHHMTAGQESTHPYDLTLQRRSALERFSYAYHAAQTTITHRAVLDILYRADLAHLHEVYLGALEAFSRFSSQEKKVAKSRPLEAFDDDVRSVAVDQMYWACYPDLQGKPRSFNKSLARKFTTTLEHAERWHALREKFSIGVLALVPRGANSWFEKLPFKDLLIYLRLIAAVNPVAVGMAEMIADKALSLWRREELPERLLRLEHLKTVDEISFKANPVKLLEEINVGVKEWSGGFHMK
ncbi:hypothetical protein B0J14DRAFT_692295 [Halenospora varia]|nr:hypothetical protein B0J14DRAFT_692295 [Halenospora varia]